MHATKHFFADSVQYVSIEFIVTVTLYVCIYDLLNKTIEDKNIHKSPLQATLCIPALRGECALEFKC